MATTLDTIRTRVRTHLVESSATFWTDAELLDLLTDGVHDLWRRIVDLYEHHFITVDESNVSLAADTSTLTGVPADVYKVVTLEPRTLGQNSSNRGLIFKPRDYNHPDFTQARASPSISPSSQVVFYDIFNQGAPVAAPVIRVAPQVSAAVDLTLVYHPTLGTLTANDDNPIPGESDNALRAWGIAYARAKERDDNAPDPEWLAVYGTEKANLISQLAKRQIHEPDVVEGMFDGWDS